MDDKKSQIELLTDALAAMTVRAMEAEAKLAEQEKRADEWYGLWSAKDKELQEVQDRLAVEINDHQHLRHQMQEYIERMEAEKYGRN